MKYYAQYDESGNLVLIGTGTGTGVGRVEITEAEYNKMLLDIQEKALLVGKLYNKQITIEDVPEQWREEILRRIDEEAEFYGACNQ